MNKINFLTFLLSSISLPLFMLLSVLVQMNVTQKFDENFLEMLRKSDIQDLLWWFPVMVRDFTHLGSVTNLVFFVIITVGALFYSKIYSVAFYFLIYTVSGLLLNIFLKDFFSRERPDVVIKLSDVYTSSFPSSHAMLSVIVIMGCALIAVKFIKNRFISYYILSTAALCVFLIGLSRLYLGVHYLSDVLAGWSLGVFWCSLFAIFLEKRKVIIY